jgi:hypothetical protein
VRDIKPGEAAAWQSVQIIQLHSTPGTIEILAATDSRPNPVIQKATIMSLKNVIVAGVCLP